MMVMRFKPKFDINKDDADLLFLEYYFFYKNTTLRRLEFYF